MNYLKPGVSATEPELQNPLHRRTDPLQMVWPVVCVLHVCAELEVYTELLVEPYTTLCWVGEGEAETCRVDTASKGVQSNSTLPESSACTILIGNEDSPVDLDVFVVESLGGDYVL